MLKSMDTVRQSKLYETCMTAADYKLKHE